ncbi:MAG: DUF447 family protein [Pirellulales bacterium]
MIVEGIVTTRNADGSINIAPMGPRVDDDWKSLVLRPFPTSTTCANLDRERVGVFHVTDDCELLARTAVDRLEVQPPLTAIDGFPVPRLANACRWYAFRAASVDKSAPRIGFDCEVVASGVVRDFLGFQRAKHAVLEAAIVATRLHLLTPAAVDSEMQRLKVIVEKTAGPQEFAAFALLEQFIKESRR